MISSSLHPEINLIAVQVIEDGMPKERDTYNARRSDRKIKVDGKGRRGSSLVSSGTQKDHGTPERGAQSRPEIRHSLGGGNRSRGSLRSSTYGVAGLGKHDHFGVPDELVWDLATNHRKG